MDSSGYSGTPLWKKLGYKTGMILTDYSWNALLAKLFSKSAKTLTQRRKDAKTQR
jgi:hypothetical protein